MDVGSNVRTRARQHGQRAENDARDTGLIAVEVEEDEAPMCKALTRRRR